MAGYVSDAVIRRLPAYYRHLRELEAAGVQQISSKELGERMGLTPSQIRQDINCFGGFGRQGFGYKVTELKQHIAEILGLTNPHKMIIIGLGNMGSAIVNYPRFSREGFETVAVIDANPEKIGRTIGNLTVQPVEELEATVEALKPDIAVLSVPSRVAQETMDRLVKAGIKAVWNFAPVDLVYPQDMVVVNVHLSDTLHILSYKMAHSQTLEG